jgi:hypothetical protein
MLNFRQSPQSSPTRSPQSVFTKAAMSQYSLDALRQRYVIEKRPLEASIEQTLRADTRAGARAILALIDKRRFENRSEGQRLRTSSVSKPLSGRAAFRPWQAWTKLE